MNKSLLNSDETARQLLNEWALKARSGEAFVVGLSGHLGAGKTAFVKRIAKGLGIEDVVNSPTYVIMKIYEAMKAGAPFKRLVHIDAYRLEKRSELEALDFEDIVSDKNNLVMIEWPENAGLRKEDVDMQLVFETGAGGYVISASLEK